MKNIILTLMSISISQLAFAQYMGPSPLLAIAGQHSSVKRTPRNNGVASGSRVGAQALDKAIEQQVARQTAKQQKRVQAQRTEAAYVHAHPDNRQITVDKKDARRVYVNGQEYQLRTKNMNLDGDANATHTHTYVSANQDTLQVVRRDNGNPSEENNFFYDTEGASRQGKRITAREDLGGTNRGEQNLIAACEKKNADGSCQYTVTRHHSSVSSDGKFPSTTVTLKRNIAAGTPRETQNQIKAGSYQSVRGTNINQTFGGNFNHGGSYDIYGPETYSRR